MQIITKNINEINKKIRKNMPLTPKELETLKHYNPSGFEYLTQTYKAGWITWNEMCALRGALLAVSFTGGKNA